MRSLRFGPAIPFALWLTACGAHSSASTPGRAEAPARQARIVLEQAESYGTVPEKRGLRGDAADASLAKTLAGSAKQAHLLADGRLAELALGIAASAGPSGHAPGYATVTYHAQRAGIAEPTPEIWLATGSHVDPLLPSVEAAIRDASHAGARTHIGAAAIWLDPAQHDAGVMVVLAISTRALSLTPSVPRSTPVGSALRIVGTLNAGFSEPVLAVTTDAGIQRVPLGRGPRFHADVPCKSAGELTLELLAKGPGGLAVIALMPVMVGAPPPSEPPRTGSVEVETGAAEVARKLYSLIAEERARRKLTPLREDARLTKIALAHSEDMLKHDFVAHVSKQSGDATERVRAAGLEVQLVSENIGRGYSASELHHGLMASPGHRANILNADARELGIGVVAQREGERDAFLVTELFTQQR